MTNTAFTDALASLEALESSLAQAAWMDAPQEPSFIRNNQPEPQPQPMETESFELPPLPEPFQLKVLPGLFDAPPAQAPVMQTPPPVPPAQAPVMQTPVQAPAQTQFPAHTPAAQTAPAQQQPLPRPLPPLDTILPFPGIAAAPPVQTAQPRPAAPQPAHFAPPPAHMGERAGFLRDIYAMVAELLRNRPQTEMEETPAITERQLRALGKKHLYMMIRDLEAELAQEKTEKGNLLCAFQAGLSQSVT